MDKKYKVGILGCGHWGKNIIRTVKELIEKYPIEINTIINTGNQKNAEEISKSFGLHVSTDLSKSLNSLDIAFIATPDNTHYSLAKQLLSRGIHTCVEKPVALQFSDVQQLVNIAAANNAIITTSHILIFHDCLKKIKEHIQSNRQTILSIFSGRHGMFPLTRGKSILTGSLIHDLSIVDFFFNESPITISQNNFSNNNAPYLLEIFLDFKNHKKVNLVGSSQWPVNQRTFLIWTNDYLYFFDGCLNDAKVYKKNQTTGLPTETVSTYVSQSQPLRDMIDDFLSASIYHTPLRIDAAHILRVSKIISLIEEKISHQTSGTKEI